MKKLLSLLGAIVIGASASQAATSFSYGPSMKKYVNKEVKYYSEISANAFKAGILADQNFTIQGQKNLSLDPSYAANYYASQHIVDAFPDLINPKQGAKPSPTAEVSSLYESVFGTNQGGFNYTIANSYGSLKAANGVKNNTNLGMLVNGNTPDNFKQPDSKTASLLSAAAGVANIVFKNDFSPSLATTVIGLLASNKIRDALNSNSIANIFNLIDDVVSKNAEPIRNVVESLTQSKTAKNAVDNKNTYSNQLQSSTQNLFKGLIYFVSGQTKKFTGDDNLAAETFYKMLTKDDSADANLADAHKLDTSRPGDTADDLINSVADFIDFGVSLLHYFRAFDEYTTKLKNPIDGFHIFSDKDNNNEVVEKVLSQQYVDSENEDDFWYNENGTRTTKLNLQNLISDLEYYLSPTDTKGYSLLRVITVLFGGTDDGFNPILETATYPLLKNDGILDKLIAPLINKIPNIPGVITDDTKKIIVNTILSTVKQMLSKGVIDWITSDGDNPDSTGVSQLISDLASLYKAINISALLGSSVDDNVKNILGIIDAVAGYLNSSDGSQFLSHPWSTLYGKGMLISIGNILQNFENSTESIRRIAYGLRNLKDIRTILTTDVSTLMNYVGVMINGTPLNIPDWLYHAKDLSISDIIKMLATDWLSKDDKANNEVWTTNRYNSLKENSHYAFNTGAIGELIESLIPAATKDDTSKTVVIDKSGNPVSIIKPLYLAIKYFGTSTQVTTDSFEYEVKLVGTDNFTKILDSNTFQDNKNTVVVSNNALEDLLGVKTVNNIPSFINGSLLGSVSRLYGHDYADKDGKALPDGSHKEMFNGSSSLFALFTMFSQFAMDSIKELIADNYAKYFDPKNWNIKNEKQKNLDNDKPATDTIQYLSYDIEFFNPDAKKWFTYHVQMHRQAVDTSNTSGSASTGWVLDQLMRQN